MYKTCYPIAQISSQSYAIILTNCLPNCIENTIFVEKLFFLGYVECSDQAWHVCQIVTSDILQYQAVFVLFLFHDIFNNIRLKFSANNL